MRKAFTLSEILVVLIVISVVAMMSFPVLKSNAVQKELGVKIVSDYSKLVQYYKQLSDREFYTSDKIKSDVDLANYLSTVMPKVTSVDENDVLGGASFSTYDGTYYSFHVNNEGCKNEIINEDGKLPNESDCYVIVDVNGLEKGPNSLIDFGDNGVIIGDRAIFLFGKSEVIPNCVASYLITKSDSDISDICYDY